MLTTARGIVSGVAGRFAAGSSFFSPSFFFNFILVFILSFDSRATVLVGLRPVPRDSVVHDFLESRVDDINLSGRWLLITLLSQLGLCELSIHTSISDWDSARVGNKLGMHDSLIFIVIIDSTVVVSNVRSLVLNDLLGLSFSKHSLIFLDYSWADATEWEGTSSSIFARCRVLLDRTSYKLVSFLSSKLLSGLLSLLFLWWGLLFALNLGPAIIISEFFHILLC